LNKEQTFLFRLRVCIQRSLNLIKRLKRISKNQNGYQEPQAETAQFVTGA
jgi:hypothetical protein